MRFENLFEGFLGGGNGPKTERPPQTLPPSEIDRTAAGFLDELKAEGYEEAPLEVVSVHPDKDLAGGSLKVAKEARRVH